jgi:hypothetical protein|tara:strand:+ start:1461 stop:1853 length:393 start_codon:yes stop_codon:yes gene_type:complete
MAVTATTTITPLGGTSQISHMLITDFDADSTVEAHVTGNTSGIIYLVEIDNTANAATSAYLRIKDAQSAGAAGTLVPNVMFYAAPGSKASYVMPEGHSYSTGVTMWCTTNNAVDNTSSPQSAVIVRIITT